MSENCKHIPEIFEIENIRQEIESFPPYYERNFTKRYCVEYSKNGLYLDTCVSCYNNKLCLLFLADGHSILKDRKTIKQLHFKVGGEDRLENVTRGKYKRCAQPMQKNSVICFIETTDGTRYPFCSGIKGKLFGINEAILKDCSQIVKGYNTTGFIAIVHPDAHRSPTEEILEGLLTREEYNTVLASRCKE